METKTVIQKQATGKRIISGSKSMNGCMLFEQVLMDLESAYAKCGRRKDANKLKLPKMSEVLKACHLAQTVGEFADEDGVCALGALGNHIGMTNKDLIVDTQRLLESYNASFPEINQLVECPKCGFHNSVFWQITHMNDVHNSSFLEIGEWLKTRDL